MSIYGTDNGPICPACESTVYSYSLDDWPNEKWTLATCYGCGRKTLFLQPPGAAEDHTAKALREAHERERAAGRERETESARISREEVARRAAEGLKVRHA